MPDFSLADILGAQAGAPGPVYEGGPTSNVTPGQVLSALGLGGPSWLDRAQQQAGTDVANYQQGGVPALLADRGETADLAGGFGGTTTPSKGIRAYHGSPYDFPPHADNPLGKFDLSRIGTGEGAQAYGHGLYFAENPAVARDYRTRLAPGTPDNIPPDEIAQAKFAPQWQQLVEERRATAGQDLRGDTSIVDAKMDALHKQMMDDTMSRNPNLFGKMYEVNINANPEQFLDWEKALKDQPAGQSILNRPPYELGYPSIKPESIGQDAYYKMAGDLKQLDSPNAHAAASEYLKSRGIPGIKYLDQGSRPTAGGQLLDVFKGPEGWQAKVKVSNRGGIGFQTPTDMFTTSKPFPTEAAAKDWANSQIGGGTSNYVVFNPDIIDIRKKWALLLAAMGGAGAPTMGGVLQSQMQPQQ